MVTKPIPGQDPWNAALDAALDDLQAQITSEATTARAAEAVAKFVTIRTSTGDATMSNADEVLLMDSASAHFVTMQSAASAEVRFYTIKNVNTGTVTIRCVSGQTIDGAATYVLAAGQLIDLLPDGSNWRAF